MKTSLTLDFLETALGGIGYVVGKPGKEPTSWVVGHDQKAWRPTATPAEKEAARVAKGLIDDKAERDKKPVTEGDFVMGYLVGECFFLAEDWQTTRALKAHTPPPGAIWKMKNEQDYLDP